VKDVPGVFYALSTCCPSPRCLWACLSGYLWANANLARGLVRHKRTAYRPLEREALNASILADSTENVPVSAAAKPAKPIRAQHATALIVTDSIPSLTDLERDALAELSNLAMARAATALRQMIKNEVRLSVPNVEILEPAAAVKLLKKTGELRLIAVRQDFSGPFSGRTILIFPEARSLELVRTIVGENMSLQDVIDLEDEALAETGNILIYSWVATLANLLKQQLKMSLPAVVRCEPPNLFEKIGEQKLLILFVHISFEISQQEIAGYLALMMDIPSIKELRLLIDEYVTSIARNT
jgi:chemotaxis protein CheC